jgi:hypothetical protein
VSRPKGSKNKFLKASYVGQTINKWTILERCGIGPKTAHTYYLCRCVCGRERPVRLDSLLVGNTKSCGCSQFERFSHLYVDGQQRCPSCDNWLPLDAFTKHNRGKIGEPCRECRRNRQVITRQRMTREERRAYTLKQSYGLTLTDYYQATARQANRCLGCQELFDPLKLVVDHDHATNKIRGLLCSNCNTVLGYVKDEEEILYRLSAYLTRDPSKLLVYLVGSLRNKTVIDVGNVIREDARFDVFDDYMAAGPEADDFWKLYETQRGRNYATALTGRAARHVFFYDKGYLDLADVIVVVLPVGRSCMLEAGYSKARGKAVYFLLDTKETTDRYDVMKRFADGLYTDLDAILKELDRLYTTLVASRN